jgi:myosin heavy subunit
LEEQVYKQEGIDFKHIEYNDNQHVLDLIEQSGKGLLFVSFVFPFSL